jgi:hypothetical protein
MLQDQALWIVLAKSARQEAKLNLAQPFVFGLSGILYQVENYMETIGYEHLLLVLYQGGIVSLQYGFIAYVSYYKSV